LEIVTNVPTLEQLSKCSLEPYDGIYLGNPYCWRYDGNLIASDDIKNAVELVKSEGKKAYVTTYAVPRNKDLPLIFKLIDAIMDSDVDAIESTNLGVINYIKKEYDFRVHAGGLTNIYTSATAELLVEIGVERIMPAYEISLEEIEMIKRTGVEIEVVIHGKIPLGISHNCFLTKFEESLGEKCPDICRREVYFESDGLVLKPFGNVTLSGKDVCMYEHIEKLIEIGVNAGRVEGISERIGYRERVGRIYRRRLEVGFDRKDLEKLLSLNRHGVCNGFYFNRTGQLYVGGGV
jgi:putative protease